MNGAAKAGSDEESAQWEHLMHIAFDVANVSYRKPKAKRGKKAKKVSEDGEE